jgi:hypothetical protein
MAKKIRLVSNSPNIDAVATPSELGEHGRALWSQVHAEYDVSDIGGRAMLREACRSLDRAEQYAARIDAEGAVVKTKTGPKEHPLVKAELAARAFVVRTLVRLGLNFEPVRTAPGRPPGFA